MSYRVVYGETMPAWEKTFDTKNEAEAFALEHLSFGDIIFSLKRAISTEPPQSIMGMIQAHEESKK